MAEMHSPGVYIEEIDASTIVPNVSMSVATFGGDFTKGPSGDFLLISSVEDLIDFYGLPTNENYNQWYQCYNFLQYGNTLYVSRAVNVGTTNSSGTLGKKPVPVPVVLKLESSDVSFTGVGDVTLSVDASANTLAGFTLKGLAITNNKGIFELNLVPNAQPFEDPLDEALALADGITVTFASDKWSITFADAGTASGLMSPDVDFTFILSDATTSSDALVVKYEV